MTMAEDSGEFTNHPKNSAQGKTVKDSCRERSGRKMEWLIKEAEAIKPKGHVLFHDYATGDLAQERFACKDQMISENFYVRGDGIVTSCDLNPGSTEVDFPSQENTESNMSLDASKEPVEHIEVDISEGVAAEMFVISSSAERRFLAQLANPLPDGYKSPCFSAIIIHGFRYLRLCELVIMLGSRMNGPL
ncbi:uncharacterized protein LOC120291976 [Eucalyptus grandis]|uniref:uncharacterized protein LOC120291976 n=1 Tax=Eucalyptus grandis TaxID=71139 RepID=UPI00192F072D|nr:uncharacterized protein LOC120291976 [Eucalyptus grandis]